MQIGELAKKCGISVQALRYYEKIALIKRVFELKAKLINAFHNGYENIYHQRVDWELAMEIKSHHDNSNFMLKFDKKWNSPHKKQNRLKDKKSPVFYRKELSCPL